MTTALNLRNLFSILICCYVIASSAQDKRERESVISFKDVPQEIQQQITPFLSDARNVKYYFETDGDHKSYEIKFSLNHREYSVEFGKDLQLEDVELLISFNSIPADVRLRIKEELEKYEKYKIKRLQKQFSSETASAAVVIRQALQDGSKTTIRYEMVVDLKLDKSWTRQELLFDVYGELLETRRVRYRPEDFILY